MFTIMWVAGLAIWWFFTYRVTVGPLVAGSEIEIDGKQVAVLARATQEYSITLPRGFHVIVVKAPGYDIEVDTARMGWLGLRRQFSLSQVREIAVHDGVVATLAPAAPRNESQSRVSAIPAPGAQAPIEPPATPARPKPDPGVAAREASALTQSAAALFSQRQYKAALTDCARALELQPQKQEAMQLRAKIRQTMEILGVH